MTDRELWVQIAVAALQAPRPKYGNVFDIADEAVIRAPKDPNSAGVVECSAVNLKGEKCILPVNHPNTHHESLRSVWK